MEGTDGVDKVHTIGLLAEVDRVLGIEKEGFFNTAEAIRVTRD